MHANEQGRTTYDRLNPHNPRHRSHRQPGWRARRPPARLKRLARSRPDPVPPERKSARRSPRAVWKIVAGDMDDIPPIDAAMDGAYGVFSVQSQAAEDDPQLEKRQGIAVADAAKRAGVSHLVYTASCGAKEPNRGVSYWDAKREIVAHIQQLGVPYTILRPVSFMENYVVNRAPIDTGVIRGMLTPDKTLQVISGHDIGAFAAAALNNPDKYQGRGNRHRSRNSHDDRHRRRARPRRRP